MERLTASSSCRTASGTDARPARDHPAPATGPARRTSRPARRRRQGRPPAPRAPVPARPEFRRRRHPAAGPVRRRARQRTRRHRRRLDLDDPHRAPHQCLTEPHGPAVLPYDAKSAQLPHRPSATERLHCDRPTDQNQQERATDCRHGGGVQRGHRRQQPDAKAADRRPRQAPDRRAPPAPGSAASRGRSPSTTASPVTSSLTASPAFAELPLEPPSLPS